MNSIDMDTLTLEQAKSIISNYNVRQKKILEKQRKYQRDYIRDNEPFRKKNTLRTRRRYWRRIKNHLHALSVLQTLSESQANKLVKSVTMLVDINKELDILCNR